MTLVQHRGVEDSALEAGTRVEVRSRFDGTWGRGFEIVATDDDGYVVRRLSDGAVQPARFGSDDVRRERRKQGLWWA